MGGRGRKVNSVQSITGIPVNDDLFHHGSKLHVTDMDSFSFS